MQAQVIFDASKKKKNIRKKVASDVAVENDLLARKDVREEGVKEGLKDTVKESVKEKRQSREKLNNLIRKSREVLFEISTYFPFDLFPNKLIIERDRIRFFEKQFFKTGQVQSIAIGSIEDVSIESSPLFATLRITDNKMGPGYEFTFKPVKKDLAKKARWIVMGLVKAAQHQIDLSNFEADELARKAEEIGKANETEI